MSGSKRAICTLTSFLAGYGHEFIIMQTFASHSLYEPPQNFTNKQTILFPLFNLHDDRDE